MFGLRTLAILALVSVPAVMSAPIEENNLAKKADYGDYGNYGKYGSYGTYAPPPPPPPPTGYGTYGSYGSYPRDAEAEAAPEA